MRSVIFSLLVTKTTLGATDMLCDDLPPPSRRSIDIRLNSEQSRARVDRSDIETSIGFERQFRTVLCKFPVAIQKYWAQQEIIGKYSRPAARRCRARKLERLLARRLNSSTRFAVLGVHDLAWVEHETLGQDPRTFQR